MIATDNATRNDRASYRSVRGHANGGGIALLLLILLIALALRLYGIDWGLPSQGHPHYSYHPDEALTIQWADDLARGKPVVKAFVYGGTFYYSVLHAASYIAQQLDSFLPGYNSMANAILVGRLVMTGLALLSIVVLYGAVQTLLGRQTATVTALLLAIAPAHVVWSQRVRPDQLSTLLILIVFYLAVQMMSTGCLRPARRTYLLCGLALGVVAATRLPLVIFAMVPICAHFVATCGLEDERSLFRKAFDFRLLSMLPTAMIGYLIASPYSAIYPEYLLSGLLTQSAYQSGTFIDALERGPTILQYGWGMLRQALSLPIYGLAAVGILLAVFRKDLRTWPLLLATIPYFLMISMVSWVVVRYTLPMVPFLCVFAAYSLRYFQTNWPKSRIVSSAILVITVVCSLWSILAYLSVSSSTNVRDVATVWMRNNLPPGARVLTVREYLEDVFYSPVIPDGVTGLVFFLRDDQGVEGLFTSGAFDYLVISDYLYGNMERLKDRHPKPSHRSFYSQLEDSDFLLAAEFQFPVSLAGKDFSTSFSSYDYRLVNPTIRLYSRQSVDTQIDSIAE